MCVRVVHVRYVSMLVHDPLVAMPVRMRLAGWIVRSMRVPMVLIVHVRMAMLHGFMDVFVLMALGQVQPDTEAHEQAGNDELQGDGLAEKQDGGQCPDKRRRRKIRASAGGAEMP